MDTSKLNKPLSEDEREEIRRALEADGTGIGHLGLDGFLTGVATRPMLPTPSGWLPFILGDVEFSSADEFSAFIGLVLRRFNEIVRLCEEGDERWPTSSLGEEEAKDWCDGYLVAARLDMEWLEDEWAEGSLHLFSVLAGEVDMVGERDSEGDVIEDAAPFLAKYRKRLPKAVRELHEYWAGRRGAVCAPQPQATSKKSGRNDPCSCGSGKKYKKCCGNRTGSPVDSSAGTLGAAEEIVPGIVPPPMQSEPDAKIEPASTIEPELLTLITERLNRTLAEISDELGVAMHMRRTTYSDYNAKVELEVAVVREDGIVVGKEAEEFLIRCGDFGFQPTDLGRTFTRGGEKFRIVGLRPRAKVPVICERMDPPDPKNLVRMGAEAVRTYFEQEPPVGFPPRLL